MYVAIREHIRRLYEDLQQATVDLTDRRAEVDEQIGALAEKEMALRNGMQPYSVCMEVCIYVCTVR